MAAFDGALLDPLEIDFLKLLTNQAVSSGALSGTVPTQAFYLGLLTTAPTVDDGTTTYVEAVGATYARITATSKFATPTGAGVTSNADCRWPVSGVTGGAESWGTIVGVGFFKSGTKATADLIAYVPLAVSVAVGFSGALTITSGGLTVSLT